MKKSMEENNKHINKARLFVKRLIDIIGGIFGVVLLIPCTIGIIIAKIITKDKGPIFYSQYRIGKNGKIFKIYKYRSMIVNADKKLKQYLSENAEMREEYKKYKKLKNDPRVTKIGQFIRKTNIDEIPQFINVLKGDMSLVGPRPYLEQEVEDMGDKYEKIVSCKPGITGLWQVNAKTKRTFDERLEIDMDYLRKNDIKFDIKILVKTIKMLKKTEGVKSYNENIISE